MSRNGLTIISAWASLYVWVVDPQTRKAFSATAATGLCEVKSGVLKTENPELEVPLAELFE